MSLVYHEFNLTLAEFREFVGLIDEKAIMIDLKGVKVRRDTRFGGKPYYHVEAIVALDLQVLKSGLPADNPVEPAADNL